jgi:hypothetical protein
MVLFFQFFSVCVFITLNQMFNKRETKLEKSFNGRIQVKFSNNWENTRDNYCSPTHF